MSATLGRGKGLARQRSLGLVFLLAVVGGVYLTTALYQKKFTPVTHVTLLADRAGNQLTPGADVKVRGLLVGQVRSITSTDQGARLDLAIAKEQVAQVPAQARALLLPKTLFGEKFVALVPPPNGTATRPVREGDTIGQDRSATSIETERVLSDTLPLLKALDPQDLSTALGALSEALRGRGQKLGENFVRTDDYLRRLNPQLPTIRANLVGLADLADTFDQAAPDFLQVLDNFSFSARSLVDQRTQLATFLKSSTGFAGTTQSFLADNRARLIGLAADSKPNLDVLARYSPGFPCLLNALTEQEGIVETTFGGRQPGLHITLETTKDNGDYQAGDEPQNGDNPGPTCRNLVPPRQIPVLVDRNAQDGYCDPGTIDPKTNACTSGRRVSGQSQSTPTLLPPGVVPSSADPAWSRAIVGAATGLPQQDVPGFATLLFDPLARGTTVSLH